jgi:hypothetical protein
MQGGGPVDRGAALLAGYERERREVGKANALLSVRNYRGVAELRCAHTQLLGQPAAATATLDRTAC